MSSRLFFLATALLASISIAASIAHAQRGGNAGMSSMGGSGFSGGMLGGMSSSLGGTGGFGSGMGGFGSGMGGFGSGMGMGGGMGSGLGGFGSGMGMGGSGMGGFGQSGMGMNQQGNQGFIGRDSADMSAIFSELGRNSNQFMQQLNRTMRRGGGRRNTTQEENAVPPVRVRLDVAFDQPTVATAVAATKVRGRMSSLLTRRNIAAPEVEVVGDTVVLRGVAKSESQRLMIERLALMEPGVYSVNNQMTVVEQPTPPLTPPAAR